MVCDTSSFDNGFKLWYGTCSSHAINMDYLPDLTSNEQDSQDILGSQFQASQSIIPTPPPRLPIRGKAYNMQVSYGNTAITGPRTTRAGKVYSYSSATDQNGNDREVEVSNTTRPSRPFTANRLVVFLEDNFSFMHYGRGEIHGLPMEELLTSFLRHVDRCWKYMCKIPALDENGRDCIVKATVRVFARVELDIRSDLLVENVNRIQNLFASSMEKEGKDGLEASYKLTLSNFREHMYAAMTYPDLLNEEKSIPLFQAAPVRRITEDENDEAFQASQGLRAVLSQDSAAFDEVEMRSNATSTPKKEKFPWVNPNGKINLNTQEFDQLMNQLAGSPRRSQRQAKAAAAAKNAAGGKGASTSPTGNEPPAQSGSGGSPPAGGGQQGGGGGGQDDGSGSTISSLFPPRTGGSSSSTEEDDDNSTSQTSGLDPGALLGRSGIDTSKGADVTAGKFGNIVSHVSPAAAAKTPSRKRRTTSGSAASATPGKKSRATVNLGQRISGASASSWSSVQNHPAIQNVLNTSNPAANVSLNTSSASSAAPANTSTAAPAVVSGHIGYPPAIAKETQQDLYDRADDMVKPVIKAVDMKMKHVRISLKTIKDRTKRTEAHVSRMDTRLKYIEDGIRVLAKEANAVKRRNELQKELCVPFNNETDAYNAVASPESQELLAEWIGLLPIRASHSQWADKVMQKLFNQEAWFRVSYHNEDKPYQLGKEHELWEFGILLLRVPPGVLDVIGTMIKSEREEATADKLLLQLRNWIRNREAGRREHMRRELQLRQVRYFSLFVAQKICRFLKLQVAEPAGCGGLHVIVRGRQQLPPLQGTGA